MAHRFPDHAATALSESHGMHRAPCTSILKDHCPCNPGSEGGYLLNSPPGFKFPEIPICPFNPAWDHSRPTCREADSSEETEARALVSHSGQQAFRSHTTACHQAPEPLRHGSTELVSENPCTTSCRDTSRPKDNPEGPRLSPTGHTPGRSLGTKIEEAGSIPTASSGLHPRPSRTSGWSRMPDGNSRCASPPPRSRTSSSEPAGWAKPQLGMAKNATSQHAKTRGQ